MGGTPELIHFEETELRLGLPGGNSDGPSEAAKSNGKRGFSETVDLKLNLSSKESGPLDQVDEKEKATAPVTPSSDPVKPPTK